MATSNSSGEKEYNFISEPDSGFQCVICLEVAKEPWQHGKCGRLFCEQCLEKLGRDKPCPNCRMEQPQYFEDNKSKRDINSLRIKCKNVNKGCEWRGTVGTLSKHEEVCCYSLVPCPNKCTDNNVMRKDLIEHLESDCPNREYYCEYCKEKGTFESITESHDNICEKKILPCSNAKCFKTMERQQLDKHVHTECPYTVMTCKYKGIGCVTRLERKDMAAHEEDDSLHLHMALNTVSSLQETVSTLQPLALKDNKSMTFALVDYQNKKEAKEIFLSPSFYMGRYHMQIKVYVNGSGDGESTHLSVYVSLLKGKYDAGLKWPFTGKRTIHLLNQLEDKNHHVKIAHLKATDIYTATRGSILGYADFIPNSALAHDPVKNTQYLKNDTLYFRVLMKAENNKPWLECTR